MKLLINTPLQLFQYDTDSSKLSLLRTGDGYYFGLSYRNQTIALTSTDGRLKYFRNGKRIVQSVPNLVQAHQVEWVEDDIILVANTGKNCVSVFDGNGCLVRDVYLNNITIDDKDANRAGNHFNSVHKQGNTVYVVAHNYERQSEVFELSWPELEVIRVHTTAGNFSHNIWICELGMVMCDSKRGRLITADTGEEIWSSGKNLFARGLAATKDYIFVGASGHNFRLDRFWKDGGLWIIDRKTLKTLDFVQFPGTGDVNDIRLVDSVDDCHTEQILYSENLKALHRVTPMIAAGYILRKKYPGLQKEVFPFSPIIKGEQTIARWARTRFQSEVFP